MYGRDRPDTAGRRTELAVAHWAYVDRYADALIARGPTLTDDGEHRLGDLALIQQADRPWVLAGADGYQTIEIHPWQFGGRR